MLLASLLWLLAQLGLSNADGGTAHTVELAWPGVTVTQTNDDGTTFVRPPLGYRVYRAPVKNNVQGPWVLLNPDALVVGMMEADGTLDSCVYRDETVQQGFSYAYAVTAADFAGETPQSNVSSVLIPINPNAPNKMQASVN